MKRKYIIVFLTILLLILCTGCHKNQNASDLTMPTPESSIPTLESSIPTESTEHVTQEDAPVISPTTTPTATEPTAPESEEIVPPADDTYTLSLPGYIPIFDEPSYDGCFVRTIGEDGVYTIIEEHTDSEGYIWGKLKSGVGYISLSELEANLPIMAGLGNEKMLQNPHHLVIVDDAGYMEYLVFEATQTITDVRLTMLLPEVGGYIEDSLLETLPEMQPGKSLIAGVVFYGDFTTYGLSFTDESGNQRHFAVYISGRNGAPVLQEYTT